MIFRPYSLLSLVLSALLAGCASGGRADLASAQRAPAEGPHQATVRLEGVTCQDCVVRVALFATPARWLKSQRPYRGRLLVMHGAPQPLTFYGLPAGSYAVAAYVDRNDNGRLDRWLGLIPREPVAYSVVQGRRLPPSFEESAFAVPDAGVVPVTFGRASGGAE